MKPLPPKPPRFGLRVSGSRLGSLVRPTTAVPEELPPKRQNAKDLISEEILIGDAEVVRDLISEQIPIRAPDELVRDLISEEMPIRAPELARDQLDLASDPSEDRSFGVLAFWRPSSGSNRLGLRSNVSRLTRKPPPKDEVA